VASSDSSSHTQHGQYSGLTGCSGERRREFDAGSVIDVVIVEKEAWKRWGEPLVTARRWNKSVL